MCYIIANLYFDQHPRVYFSSSTYSLLPIRSVVEQIDIAINLRQRHLRWKPILGTTSRTRLMHQADTRDVTLRRPSAIERALINRLFVGVETELDHAEWDCASDKHIAAAI